MINVMGSKSGLADHQVGMALAMVADLGVIVLCGLDRHFGWSTMRPVVSILGDGLVALGLPEKELLAVLPPACEQNDAGPKNSDE